jgi:hypothetical protein
MAPSGENNLDARGYETAATGSAAAAVFQVRNALFLACLEKVARAKCGCYGFIV